ncbi:hypothetical protein, partial [Sphingobacterium sp.]|uniref:hypothetical protein n=1 Tax=Sphingobacterium sp. TaxID=341027 RepID=UPI0028A2B293
TLSSKRYASADVKQMHTFLMKVCRVLMAYFLVHFRKIDIDAVLFAFAEPAEVITADLEAKRRIHSFFNRFQNNT